MATDGASMPVNGAYASAPGQNYGPTEQNLAAHNATAASAPNPSDELSKEEVGWYFVERYYTTLSKTPDKLFLYYNKKSRSVFGVEEEKAPVCVGQRSIQDRMAELDFHDCKVRVSNVDSQESGDAILIQVIGEISNKSQPHRKFVQTFVLATQTNGYYVLNDVFRYIAEEELEEPADQEETPGAPAETSGYQEPAPTAEEEEPKGLTNNADPAQRELEAQIVDEHLEEAAHEEPKAATPPSQVNGTPVPEDPDVAEAENAPAAAVKPAEAPSTTESTDETLQPERPKDPDPTPAPSTPAQAATKPAPPKPAAPKTWASMAASAANPAPARPAASPVATPQQKPTPQAPQAPQAPNQTATPPSAPAASTPPAREQSDTETQPNDGWQAVSSDHSRKQSRVQAPAGSEPTRFRAYIKNVFPSVDGDALRKELSNYGELIYFDISRQKNCAFVDFATLKGFQAAVEANPHTIGNDQIFVEERRERPYPYQPRGPLRGGRGGGDNRLGQGRGGFGGAKENMRGGYQPRGRGNMIPRGRGAAQAQ